uniref:acetyl-CoA carboxylase biotin carboxyl carrier protein n=1 Tax=Galdieria phlegrea TaxID=1389228 RepID=UPI0023D86E02|nr:acetyl-CoA carboxylase biotin carboxyl carrier protein [Galdieria phlegrea]UNJ16209.1 acetyl-CoA carboxylase biotin carboxyl carrier protein [Galdieria sp.]WDA99549.1 acetyl-CoA carboxylase biotin carboxyl carrier protein [Galdieria sulphuraria]WDA99739.1 acetyl-CoA carboxylase biotin carboxyl carrier protein [Galdieria phlegrea]
MGTNIEKIIFLLQELNLDFYHIQTKSYEISSKRNESLLHHNFNINFNIYYSTLSSLQTKPQTDFYTNADAKNPITSNNLINQLNLPIKDNKNTFLQQEKKENDEYIDITSPLAGIFYSSPVPGADPFVKIGSIVEPNTIVCIIETMKVMNQIKANHRGKIEKILFRDGDEVSIGDTIMQISSL